MRSDTKMIKSFHTYFVFPHFDFFQGGDPLTDNTAGFQACLICVRYFIMIKDLSKHASAYGSVSEFSDFVTYKKKILNVEERKCQHWKLQEFIRVMDASIDKHFSRWEIRELLILSLFSEFPTAQVFARYILGQDI